MIFVIFDLNILQKYDIKKYQFVITCLSKVQMRELLFHVVSSIFHCLSLHHANRVKSYCNITLFNRIIPYIIYTHMHQNCQVLTLLWENNNPIRNLSCTLYNNHVIWNNIHQIYRRLVNMTAIHVDDRTTQELKNILKHKFLISCELIFIHKSCNRLITSD